MDPSNPGSLKLTSRNRWFTERNSTVTVTCPEDPSPPPKPVMLSIRTSLTYDGNNLGILGPSVPVGKIYPTGTNWQSKGMPKSVEECMIASK